MARPCVWVILLVTFAQDVCAAGASECEGADAVSLLHLAHRVEVPARGARGRGPLGGVGLVVHCRASWSLCERRRGTADGYRPHFADVLWMVAPEEGGGAAHPPWAHAACPVDGGDPHACLARLLSGSEARTWTGLLYMHFDAVVSPCRFQEQFDPTAIGIFRSFREMSEAALEDERWLYWTPNLKKKYQAAMATIVDRYPDIYESGVMRPDMFVRTLCDDIFYVPRPAFGTYAELAHVFAEEAVFHELAGPAIFKMTAHLVRAQLQDLGCDGWCCNPISVETLKNDDFRCGHSVDWRDPRYHEGLALVQARVCPASRAQT